MDTHRSALLGLAAVLCLGLTGCVPFGPWGVACPAVMYIPVVRVLLTGDAASVTEVALCDDAGVCSVRNEDLAEVEDGPLTVLEPGQLGGEPPERPESAPIEIPPYLAHSVGANEWTISVMGELPEDVTVTAYGADGSVAGVSSAALDWVRVGGSEQCGGPTEAGPVTVAIG